MYFISRVWSYLEKEQKEFLRHLSNLRGILKSRIMEVGHVLLREEMEYMEGTDK